MRAVVFDLDGTLIDSAPDIRSVVNRVLAADGLAPISGGEIRGMIGDGAKILLDRAFAVRGQKAAPRHLAAFVADYERHAVVETAPYPGIIVLLERFQAEGRKLGLCTNKPEGPTREILQALDLEKYFSSVLGGDSTPYRKPDPRHLAAVLAQLGVADAVMIGDHENDLAAAAGLGLPAIFCAWGYGRAAALHVAHTAGELPALLARMG